MNMSGGWWLFVGSVAMASLACSAADLDEAAVRRLVAQFSAASASDRDEAERVLLDHGPVILAWVVSAKTGATGETAFRLRCLQDRLEEMAMADRVEAAIDTLTFSVGRVVTVGSGRGVRVPLQVAWEPTFQPLAMRLPVHTVMADGPAAEALPPVQRQAVIEPLLAPNASSVSLPIALKQIDPPLTSLATLRGTLALWIAGCEHDFELPLDGPSRSLHVGQATVTLLDAVVRDNRLEVTAAITFDGPSEALASHRPWLAQRRIEVVGNDGQPLSQKEQRTSARSDRGLTTIAAFTLPATPDTSGLRNFHLRWRLPIAVHAVPVDFLVRDVPLPTPQSDLESANGSEK